MFTNNSELKALLLLIDDPDEYVYESVSDRIIKYGKDIIPTLESYVEINSESIVQSRIHDLIKRVYLTDLHKEFANWAEEPQPSLLKGAILIAKYNNPELNETALYNHFEQIKRNVWLELNSFLTPIEQINVINTIFFSFYKFKGHELTERKENYFYLNHLLSTRNGNAYSIGIFYLSVCEILDLPVFAMNIPRQFVFGYIQESLGVITSTGDFFQKIQFYIDPVNGSIYSQNDIDVYLKKIKAEDLDTYMIPVLNKFIIYKMLEELSICFNYNNQKLKAKEIRQIMKIIMC